jgi:hypothetical protein
MKRAAIGLVVVAAVAGVLASRGLGQQPRSKLSAFMRPKLEHSKAVLEGLALENFDEIARGARAMKELSEAAEWRVSPSVLYLRYSSEFQRLAGELIANANEKDIDGATLAYVQLTINCVNCHKHVRQDRLISSAPPPPGVEARVRCNDRVDPRDLLREAFAVWAPPSIRSFCDARRSDRWAVPILPDSTVPGRGVCKLSRILKPLR